MALTSAEFKKGDRVRFTAEALKFYDFTRSPGDQAVGVVVAIDHRRGQYCVQWWRGNEDWWEAWSLELATEPGKKEPS